MKKLLLSVASFAMLAGGALAADLPSRKAEPLLPPPPPPPLWNGFYAGLNAGYNWGTNTNTFSQNWSLPGANGVMIVAPVAMDGIGSHAQDGFMGGAQIGYNYQWTNNILIGVETDIQGTNTRGTSRTSGLANEIVGSNTLGAGLATMGATGIQGGIDYLGTVRGRVGYLWNPTLLVYGTGGFAYGGAYANVAQSAVTTASAMGLMHPDVGSLWVGGGQRSQLLTGWTAGGGLEWMFMPNWSLKGEALYWDLGRMNVETAAYNPTLFNAVSWGRSSVNYSGVTARAGINYHFNFGGSAPVVAKY